MHVIGAKGVAFAEACTPEFKAYSQQIIDNTQSFVDAFNELGVVTMGSENHMFMIDTFKSYNVTGDVAEKVLEVNDIIVNKNLLPNDVNKPMSPSGIRIGTPAMTTKGYKQEDFISLAERMHFILSNIATK
jgi:glycine hydroxymethyltransferase